MTHITDEQMEDLLALLQAERDSLDEELAEHGKKVDGDWQGAIEGENEADPNDAADQMEELATNVPLVEELESRRKEVAEALKKIKAGTYGMCSVGGEPIPLDRLMANPAAQTCVEHA